MFMHKSILNRLPAANTSPKVTSHSSTCRLDDISVTLQLKWLKPLKLFSY